MATRTRTTRVADDARQQVLKDLKDDHRRVRKAYREFQKLDGDKNPDACEAIVQQVLAELRLHSRLEEEFLYPAAREALRDESLVDEAEVEHESLHHLIDQLATMSPDDDKYAARFVVLCEYVMHHVKEEEGEMFPQLEHAKLDWETLAADIAQMRAELAPPADARSAPEPADRAPSDDARRRPATTDSGHREPARRPG